MIESEKLVLNWFLEPTKDAPTDSVSFLQENSPKMRKVRRKKFLVLAL